MKKKILQGKIILTEQESGWASPCIQLKEPGKKEIYLHKILEKIAGIKLEEVTEYNEELQFPGDFKITIEYKKD